MNKHALLLPLRLAALLGFLAVALGAFGAHALKESLGHSGHLETWKTAVFYQFVHALAVLALPGLASVADSVWLRRAAWAWIAGTVIFCGSLYGLSVGGPRWLGPVTPLGGLAFLAGWALLLFSMRNTGKQETAPPG